MRNQLYLCWNSYLIRDAPNCISACYCKIVSDIHTVSYTHLTLPTNSRV